MQKPMLYKLLYELLVAASNLCRTVIKLVNILKVIFTEK